MKGKLSVLALGVTMVLMVSACGAEATQPEKPVPPVQTVQTEQVKSDPTPAPEPEATEDTGEAVEVEPTVEVEPVVNVEPVSEAEPEAEPQEIYTFTDCNETVYATSTVNLRSGPSTEYDKAGSMGTGDSVTRTGIGTGDYSSWSRVQLADGSIVYVSSNYISTTKPVVQSSTPSSTPSGGSSDGEAWAAANGQGLQALLDYKSDGNSFTPEKIAEGDIENDPSIRVNMG